jgi:succinate dehydrogenase (ubiquinone) flavoprotein subunit
VYGANHLGANSLLDIVVFGRVCALRIADIAKPGDAITLPSNPDDVGMDSLVNLDKLRYSDGDLLTAEIRNTMQDVRPKRCPRGRGRLMRWYNRLRMSR